LQAVGGRTGRLEHAGSNQSKCFFGAIVGTASGAGLATAIWSASGYVGTGAAVDAASRILVGTAMGANAGQVYG